MREGAPADRYRARADLYRRIRTVFEARGFIEVETPLLVPAPGMEPHLEVFETRLTTENGRSRRAFLTTSPEYQMKKLLAAGLPRIFQIGKAFRNREEASRLHNQEFTILEWYRTTVDYHDLIRDCEDLLLALAGGKHLTYGGQTIDLSPPWPRLTVAEAFHRHAGVDLDGDLLAQARSRGYTVDEGTTWEQAFTQILLTEVEPRFPRDRPLVLDEYPASQAALARLKADNPRRAERFEVYVAGIEIANAFGELLDATEQARRLEQEREERQRSGRVPYDIDRDFIRALAAGIPPSAGIALGVDRLLMILTDAPSIRDVLWFPAAELFDLEEF